MKLSPTHFSVHITYDIRNSGLYVGVCEMNEAEKEREDDSPNQSGRFEGQDKRVVHVKGGWHTCRFETCWVTPQLVQRCNLKLTVVCNEAYTNTLTRSGNTKYSVKCY